MTMDEMFCLLMQGLQSGQDLWQQQQQQPVSSADYLQHTLRPAAPAGSVAAPELGDLQSWQAPSGLHTHSYSIQPEPTALTAATSAQEAAELENTQFSQPIAASGHELDSNTDLQNVCRSYVSSASQSEAAAALANATVETSRNGSLSAELQPVLPPLSR